MFSMILFFNLKKLHMELCQPDVFTHTSEHIVCVIRQSFFNLTRHIGQTDSVAFEGYSPTDYIANAVFCGQGCANEESDDNRKVEAIGCNGSTNNLPFNIGSTLTKVHGEDNQPIVLRIPESICNGEGKSLFVANQMRAAGHIVNDVPKRHGGQQHIRLHEALLSLCFIIKVCVTWKHNFLQMMT